MSTLQNNNNNLQAILQTINSLPEAGGSASSEVFWDAFLEGGTRERFNYAFAYGWTDETFNPPYPIVPMESYTTCMFEETNITTVDNTKVDFTETTGMQGAFRNSNIQHVIMEIPYVSGLNQTFLGASQLQSLTIVGLSADCTFTNTFRSCSNLEDLQIYGTIGKSGLDLSACTKLTAQTIVDHVLSNLADKTGTGSTWTCTLGTTNLNKLSDTQKAIATQKGWTLA